MKIWTYVLGKEAASDSDYENQTMDDDGYYVVSENNVELAKFDTLEQAENFINS